MEVHLDLVGGLGGDMFIAALLDAFPEYEPDVLSAIQVIATEISTTCTVTRFNDGVLVGKRFDVILGTLQRLTAPFTAAQQRHSHTSWASIRTRLQGSALPAPVIQHAIGIFHRLAEAEAWVHGIDLESVGFHEVGAWDSIADVVGAATLIASLNATRWTCSAIPLGRGRVKTAHGVMPVPAPATARLLMGMSTLDDGISGERVTPTGAAILRYLCTAIEFGVAPARTRMLVAAGTGFGHRELPGLSNHVRVLCFEPATTSPIHRSIEVLEFEIDDQSMEDLAAGLDRLRAHVGVLDVTQAPVFGKKGRMMIHVQVLARATHVDAVTEACFRETTTLGLRQSRVHGVGLDRRMREVEIEGQRLRVKIADRPGGCTAKAESDDVLAHEAHARRASMRQRAESAALQLEANTHA